MKFEKLKEGIYPFNAGAIEKDIYGFTSPARRQGLMAPSKTSEEEEEEDQEEQESDEAAKKEIINKEKAIKDINEPDLEDEEALPDKNKNEPAKLKSKTVNKLTSTLKTEERYVDSYEGKVLYELTEIVCDIYRLDYLKEFFSYFEESHSDAFDMISSEYAQIMIERCKKYKIDARICANKIYQKYLQEKWQNIPEQ